MVELISVTTRLFISDVTSALYNLKQTKKDAVIDQYTLSCEQ